MNDRFTLDNSLHEILVQAGKEICLFFPDFLFQMIPEEYRNIPLRDWAESYTMPWGLPFPLKELLNDSNMIDHASELWDWVPLWEEGELTLDSNDTHAVGLMIPKTDLTGVRPAVIICPGGGYETIAFNNEGMYTARRMETAGYRTFILNYRLSPNRYPIPQLDLALAIKHVRANAAKYQIDPDNLMILGYSAGGHLCASTAALRQEIEAKLMVELALRRPDLAEDYRDISIRPNKVCLCYPVISFLSEDHEPSFQALSGGDETLRAYLSIETQVDDTYPKTFVWHCEDDSLVPCSNAVRMAKALEEKHVPHLLKLYPQGEHGCHLGTGTSAEGWPETMLEFMK